MGSGYLPPMTWVLALALFSCPASGELASLDISASRDYRVSDLPIDITVTARDAKGEPLSSYCGGAIVSGLSRDGMPVTTIDEFVGGQATLKKVKPTAEVITIAVERQDGTTVTGTWKPDLRQVPGILSLFPPLIAILLAILFREALIALFAGVWIGALFIHDYNPVSAFLRCFDTYLPMSLADKGHADIIVFSLALGGMVGIISKSGGTRALVDAIAARASSRRSGQLTAWFSGMIVFFDDYANCLLVGNTVRPFTDRLRISREKLSYIVDSTAAPIATVALVSTWVGYQIGLFEDTFGNDTYGMAGQGYQIFLNVLPYSFYSLFTIAFVAAIAITLRDFGPIAKAEERALRTGAVIRAGAEPLMDKELTEMAPDHPERAHWSTAIVPVVSVLVIVILGLYVSGRDALGSAAADADLTTIVGKSDPYAVLLWAAFGGSLVAFVMARWRGTVTMRGALAAWVAGAKSMVMAIFILVLAWALGSMCKEYLMTGPWVLDQVAPSPHFLPVITFAVSGVIALTTGSSYSTMAIVIPIAGPMAWALTGTDAGLDVSTVESIRYATLAAVLSGAVFGDHCSPISDTTIMSSMSSAADHLDHVRTQAPYAAVCAGGAIVFGFLPAGYGISPAISLPLGIIALVAVVRFVGRLPPAAASEAAAASADDPGEDGEEKS